MNRETLKRMTKEELIELVEMYMKYPTYIVTADKEGAEE